MHSQQLSLGPMIVYKMYSASVLLSPSQPLSLPMYREVYCEQQNMYSLIP